MTVREVSAYLKVHPATIYRLLKHHQIPAVRVGKDWRFDIETIDYWCLAQDARRANESAARDTVVGLNGKLASNGQSRGSLA